MFLNTHLQSHIAFHWRAWNPSSHCDPFGSSLGSENENLLFTIVHDVSWGAFGLARIGLLAFWSLKRKFAFSHAIISDGLLFRPLQPMTSVKFCFFELLFRYLDGLGDVVRPILKSYLAWDAWTQKREPVNRSEKMETWNWLKLHYCVVSCNLHTCWTVHLPKRATKEV